jgi:hypothetical protein
MSINKNAWLPRLICSSIFKASIGTGTFRWYICRSQNFPTHVRTGYTYVGKAVFLSPECWSKLSFSVAFHYCLVFIPIILSVSTEHTPTSIETACYRESLRRDILHISSIHAQHLSELTFEVEGNTSQSYSGELRLKSGVVGQRKLNT